MIIGRRELLGVVLAPTAPGDEYRHCAKAGEQQSPMYGPGHRHRSYCPEGAPVGRAVARISWWEVNSVSSLLDFIKSDLPKLIRFAAVSCFTVPLGLFLTWVFLDVLEWQRVIANVVAVTLATIPNYILNRYWVWNKRGANSMSREITPFWAMAFLGLAISTFLIWLVGFFTDATFVFLALQFFAFGAVWLLKFFVLEKYLFGSDSTDETPVEATA